MYMVNKRDPVEFEWDKGNIHKSYKKHNISPNQAEEIFKDVNAFFKRDTSHSKYEIRYVAIGKTSSDKILYIVFTIRKDKIRIISARRCNIKERRLYEKTKENSPL